MSWSTTSPVDANVRHVVRNVLTVLTSICPQSSLSASTRRPRVPYLITRTSSSRHCSRARRSSSASTPDWHAVDVGDASSAVAAPSSVTPSSSSWLSRSRSCTRHRCIRTALHFRTDRIKSNSSSWVDEWTSIYFFILFSNKGPKGLLQVATKYNIIQCIHSYLHIHITHTYTHNHNEWSKTCKVHAKKSSIQPEWVGLHDVCWSHVAWSVCLCAGHTDVLHKNGWTEWDAVWGTEPCVRWEVKIRQIHS